MPVLEIFFLAERYHATAWGRNVNEGEPEWPPSAQSADPDNQTEVHTLLSRTAYADLPYLPMTGKGKKKRACSWLEALAQTTETLRADG